LEPLELRALVPYEGQGDRRRQEVAERITVFAVSDNGWLIGALLREGARLGSGDHASDDYAAWLAVNGAEGLDGEDMIGVLAPDEDARAGKGTS
jgi:hypothetical protein